MTVVLSWSGGGPVLPVCRCSRQSEGKLFHYSEAHDYARAHETPAGLPTITRANRVWHTTKYQIHFLKNICTVFSGAHGSFLALSAAGHARGPGSVACALGVPSHEI